MADVCCFKLGAIYSELFGHMDFLPNVCEQRALTSQIAISNFGRGGRRTKPYAFTEHGALQVATRRSNEYLLNPSICADAEGADHKRGYRQALGRNRHNIIDGTTRLCASFMKTIRPVLMPPEEPGRDLPGFAPVAFIG